MISLKTSLVYSALNGFADGFGLTLDDLTVQILLETRDEALIWIRSLDLGVDCYVRLREMLNGGTKVVLYNRMREVQDA